MRVNVGCGNFPRRGWVNIDLVRNADVQPDVRASARALPFRKHSIERLYVGHLLEHLPMFQVTEVAERWRDHLAPAGEMGVVGPDLDRALNLYPDNLALHKDIRAGAGRWPGDAHLWNATEAATIPLLTAAGWRVEITSPTALARSGWPVVSEVYWQFALLCRVD